MSFDSLLRTRYPKPACVGVGLVALDIVLRGREGTPVLVGLGGSCGNVLAALAYLGWDAHPVARLADDEAAGILVADAARWRVRTEMLSRTRTGSTPIIIERVWSARTRGRDHTFERVCPSCGVWFPQAKPVLRQNAREYAAALPVAQVFYLDRATPAALELARIAKDRGAAVFFEPSGIQDERLFAEAVALADVLKYSEQRLGGAKLMASGLSVPLQIETRGVAGLRYRWARSQRDEWILREARSVAEVTDSAGSGDWCSAGIIHSITRSGGWSRLTQERLNKAVDFGQALAALNCRFEGARGVMYCLTKREFARVMKMGEPGTGGFRQRSAPISATPLRTLLSVCPGCAAGSTTREMPPCRSQQVDQRGVPIVCTLSAAGSI